MCGILSPSLYLKFCLLASHIRSLGSRRSDGLLRPGDEARLDVRHQLLQPPARLHHRPPVRVTGTCNVWLRGTAAQTEIVCHPVGVRKFLSDGTSFTKHHDYLPKTEKIHYQRGCWILFGYDNCLVRSVLL